MRILLVEDNELASTVLVRALELAGHEVVVCFDAFKALIQLSDNGFDVCIVDYRLPGIDGQQMLRIARQITHARMIAITGGPTHHLEGWNAILEKPVSREELLKVLG